MDVNRSGDKTNANLMQTWQAETRLVKYILSLCTEPRVAEKQLSSCIRFVVEHDCKNWRATRNNSLSTKYMANLELAIILTADMVLVRQTKTGSLPGSGLSWDHGNCLMVPSHHLLFGNRVS